MFIKNTLKVPSVVKGRLLGTENNGSAAKTGKGPVPGGNPPIRHLAADARLGRAR